MPNEVQFFNIIPNDIFSLIIDNLTIHELLQRSSVCKRFNSFKFNLTTLTLSDNCIKHFSNILNRVKNNCIQQTIIDNLSKMTHNHIRQLAQLHHIKTLIVRQTILNNSNETKIRFNMICENYKDIKHLSLSGMYIRCNDDWMNLLKLKSLEILKLNFCHFNSDIFKHMINLRELSVKGSLDPNFWDNVVNLQNIEKLDIMDCYMSSEQFVRITNLRKLKCLNIASCAYIIRDKDFENIINLQELQEFTICVDYELTNQNLIHLTKLNKLRKLNICGGDHLTDDGLLHITNITSLQELTLNSCPNISSNALMRAAFRIPKIIY